MQAIPAELKLFSHKTAKYPLHFYERRGIVIAVQFTNTGIVYEGKEIWFRQSDGRDVAVLTPVDIMALSGHDISVIYAGFEPWKGYRLALVNRSMGVWHEISPGLKDHSLYSNMLAKGFFGRDEGARLFKAHYTKCANCLLH